MALIDDGGADWGCYGSSLVPVLPQAPGGAQHPPAPPTLRPWFYSMLHLVYGTNSQQPRQTQSSALSPITHGS